MILELANNFYKKELVWATPILSPSLVIGLTHYKYCIFHTQNSEYCVIHWSPVQSLCARPAVDAVAQQLVV